VYRVDVAAEKIGPTLFRKAELKGNVDLDNFETKQVLFFDGLPQKFHLWKASSVGKNYPLRRI